VSFIKLDQELYGSRFFVVRAEDCGMYGECGAIIETRENGRYGASIHVFKSEEEAGQYARQYWEDYIDSESSEEVVHLLGAENLIQWALGKPAGPGSRKVNSLEEWLDLYKEDPSEHFEDGPFEIEAIGENIIEKLGFRPAIAYSMG
jgi:hypothetical protein|tara:strand:+ start:234 stop:674 length:441 start_codon:yes stop_codon:yes gene_type:complete